MFRCELHRLEGNDRLWADWRDLLTRVRPELRLFGPEWFSVWGRTIGSQAPWTGALDVAAVYDESDGRLFGVLPVGHPKVGLLRVNALGGYFQPWRLILADESREYDVGRAVGWFLIEMGWNIMQLGPWPMGHEAHQGALSALDELEMPIQTQSSCGLAIAELPATWPQYQDEVVGREFLRKIRTYENKLERDYQLEVRHDRNPSPEETGELLAALAQVEQRSWLVNDPRGRPRFIAPTNQRFWCELIQQSLVPNGQLDCWLMRANGQPMSFVFALTSGTTRYVIANNYDETFAAYRTGSVLYRRMFEEGYSRGVTRYDFGTNELHYKKRWGAQYADRIDTFRVSTGRMIAGVWQAGVKLKSLLDGHLWGRPAPAAQLASGELSPTNDERLSAILAEADEALSAQQPSEETAGT
jgi:hypothetical protein